MRCCGDRNTQQPVVCESHCTRRWQKRLNRELHNAKRKPYCQLFLYLHEWRIKAYCHLRKEPRTFVINRIKNAWALKETFKPDHKIIDSVTLDNIVSYKKVRGVKIRLTGDAVKFAKANQMHSGQKIKKNRDGSFLFSIPEVPAEVVVPWILSQKGEAVPIEPPEIVEAVRKGAQATLDSLAK